MPVVVWPVVGRKEILAVFQPGAPRTPARLQTLRRHKAVSAGMRTSVRSGARLQGQERWYSTLNLDAAVLARHGRYSDAAQVAAAAEELERRWVARLHDLGMNPTDIAPGSTSQVDVIALFAAETEQIRAQLGAVVAEVKVITGHLEGLEGHWAKLRTALDEQLALPRDLIADVRVAVGDAMALLVEQLEGASVLRPLLAIDVGVHSALPSEFESSEGRKPSTSSVRADADDEADELAVSYLAALDEPIRMTEADIRVLEGLRQRGQSLHAPPGWTALAG